MFQKKSKFSNLLINILVGLLFLIGLLVVLHSPLLNYLNQSDNAKAITSYQTAIQQLDEEERNQMKTEALEYNQTHDENQIGDLLNGKEYTVTEPYASFLNPMGNQVMGSIEIPRLHLKLQIYHGTSNKMLDQAIGHVEGSSLPIGGPSTHAVLVGKRGSLNKKLLLDLDVIDKGDKFFLTILDEVYEYEVDQIHIAEQKDTQYLQIEEGQEYVTLVTGTPYRVNSHRLLVRGHRIPYNPEDIAQQNNLYQLTSRDKPTLYTVIGLVVLFLALLVARFYYAKKKRKKVIEEKIKEAEKEPVEEEKEEIVSETEDTVEEKIQETQEEQNRMIVHENEYVSKALQNPIEDNTKAP